MVDGTFVDALGKRLPQPHVVQVHGLEYLLVPTKDGGWEEPAGASQPSPLATPLAISTLTGVLGYLEANRDELNLGTLLVHVRDPLTVEVRAKLEGYFRQRETLVLAKCHSLMGEGFTFDQYHDAECHSLMGEGFTFDQYHDAELFNVALQTRFVATPERDKLIAFVAGIRENNVRETVDDGVAQVVTAKAGIALVQEARVPNPVTLQPFRTFREVEQPESAFVLRLKAGSGDKPVCALFEADGGAWKLEAITRIATFLRTKLPQGMALIA